MQKLYHGTSMKFVKDIMNNGLRPREDRKSNFKCLSRPDHVYLTEVYAGYFAFNACDDGEDWLIIECHDCDADLLYPDEDFIWHAVRRDWKNEDWQAIGTSIDADIHEQTVALHAVIDDYKDFYTNSLQAMSTVAYRGTITNFTAYRFPWKEHKQVAFACIDPIIAPINFQLCGEKYRELTEYVLNASDVIGPS